MLAEGSRAARDVFALAMLVPGAHLLWQLHALDIDRPLLCLRLFKSNRDTGALIPQLSCWYRCRCLKRTRHMTVLQDDRRENFIRTRTRRARAAGSGNCLAPRWRPHRFVVRDGALEAAAIRALRLLGFRLAGRAGFGALHPRPSKRVLGKTVLDFGSGSGTRRDCRRQGRCLLRLRLRSRSACDRGNRAECVGERRFHRALAE